ncbi:MAG: MFS transporter [Gammaproteobacteria bacterium]|nr:MFS transporter [Gammaproteobacteria bacterium]
MIAQTETRSPVPAFEAVRWRIAILLCLVTTISYVDRQALSVAAPVLREEFRLSNTQYGWITYAFLMAYALGQFALGPLIDRLGTKRSFTLAVAWWSVAGMLHAFGRGFLGFFSLRALLGLTEAVNFPAALKAVAEWFPRNERSLATGIVTAGTGIGAIVAPPLVGLLIHFYGWQAAFLVPGAAGFLWVLAWKRWYDPPETHTTITAEERSYVLDGRAAPGAVGRAGRWRDYLRHKETWGLILARFTGDGAFYFFAFWLPNYLHAERGFDIVRIAWVAALPFVAADLGALFGGWLGGRLMASGATLDAARKGVIWLGALLVPVAMPAVFVDSPYVAVLLVSAALFAIQVKQSSLFAVPMDLFPARDVASVWGLSGAAGSLAAAFAQPLIGWLIDHYSYTPVFALVSLMHVASALAVTLLIPRIAPLERDGVLR